MKKFAIGAGVLLLILAIGLGGWKIISGKNKSPTMSTRAITDEEVKKIIETTKQASDEYIEPQQSATEKIYSAFESGGINAETYARLTLTALYGDTSTLPGQYQGAKDTSKDHAFMYGLINAKWHEFSPEAQAEIRPFLYAAVDPSSYFYYGKFRETEKETSLKILEKLLTPDSVRAEEPVMVEIPTIDVAPRIILSHTGAADKQMAEWAAQGIRDGLAKFTGLFGFEHRTVYADMVGEELKADGEASIDENSPDTCLIKVRRQNDERGTKTTASHELFHCYQFWYGLKYELPDTMWLMEATATWSEDYVYKSYATEHSYDISFFPVTNLDLMSTKGNHEYALYLWYFFLEQRGGATEIMAALKAGKTDAIRQGTQARGNFNREYREFAYWNWNWDPFKQYLDTPKFPDVSPFWKSITINTIQELGDVTYPVSLAKGGMLYNYLQFDNEEIKLIEFFPKNFSGTDTNSAAGMQAFYKVNGQWQYEDWTGLEKRDFCRELDEENIQFVVVVTSNANLNSELARPIEVKTREKCSPGWKGSITVQWTHHNEVDIGFSKGTYTEKGEYSLYETLEYDSEDDALVVADQQYFGRYDELNHVEAINKSCGQLWSKNSKRIYGAGWVDYKKDGEMPKRARSFEDKEVNKLGGTYNLYFRIFGKKDGDKFTGSDLLLQQHKSCWGGIVVPETEGLISEPYEYTTDSVRYEPNEVEITINPDDKAFTGEDKFEMYDNVFGTVRWSFRKIE